jgi:hypothetical protein
MCDVDAEMLLDTAIVEGASKAGSSTSSTTASSSGSGSVQRGSPIGSFKNK